MILCVLFLHMSMETWWTRDPKSKYEPGNLQYIPLKCFNVTKTVSQKCVPLHQTQQIVLRLLYCDCSINKGEMRHCLSACANLVFGQLTVGTELERFDNWTGTAVTYHSACDWLWFIMYSRIFPFKPSGKHHRGQWTYSVALVFVRGFYHIMLVLVPLYSWTKHCKDESPPWAAMI